MIDRVTAKRLGTMDAARPDDVSERHGVLPGLVEHKKVQRFAVMFLDDGRIVVPELRTRDGKAPVVERLLLDRDADPVLVTARDPGGTLWYGPWSDLSDPNVVLTHTVPLDGERATWPRAAARADGCTWSTWRRLVHDAESRCGDTSMPGSCVSGRRLDTYGRTRGCRWIRMRRCSELYVQYSNATKWSRVRVQSRPPGRLPVGALRAPRPRRWHL